MPAFVPRCAIATMASTIKMMDPMIRPDYLLIIIIMTHVEILIVKDG